MKWTWAPNQESSHIIMANCLGHFSCSLSLAWIGEELNTVKWHCKFHYIESERKLILEFIYIRERMREEACRKYLRLVSCSLESTLHCWAPTKSLSSRWAGRGWHNKGLGWDGPSTFHSIPWCCCCVLAQSGQQGVIIRWTNNKTGPCWSWEPDEAGEDYSTNIRRASSSSAAGQGILKRVSLLLNGETNSTEAFINENYAVRPYSQQRRRLSTHNGIWNPAFTAGCIIMRMSLQIFRY